jgi:hypothetical protein
MLGKAFRSLEQLFRSDRDLFTGLNQPLRDVVRRFRECWGFLPGFRKGCCG